MNPQLDNNSGNNMGDSDQKSDNPAAMANIPNSSMQPISNDANGQTDQAIKAISLDVKDDNDDPEEEWIHKAKAVVEHTRYDPYEQSRQLSRVKASFLKTHYNKDIKVAEDDT